MTYERILVATDGSEPAIRATTEAVTLAKAFDATLHAVYVLEVAEPPPWFNDPAVEPGVDTKAGRAIDGVVSAAADRGLEREVVTTILQGKIGPAILSYADEHDIDLIVVGTHGRTGLDRLLIGSVAEHLVREAPVPVVTVQSE